MKGKRIIVAVSLTAQAAICLYCSLLAFLWSVWFLDDSVAAQMQSAGWAGIGLIRFGQSSLVALVFAAGTFTWNRYVLRFSPRWASWVSLFAFLLIVASSLVGVVRFVWTTPFI